VRIKKVFSKPLLSLALALLLWIPAWMFQLHGLSLQNIEIVNNDLTPLCLWDCQHYGRLVDDLKPSAFFPLFPAIVLGLKTLLEAFFAVSVASWSATVLTSAIFSIAAITLALQFGREYWKGHPDTVYGLPTPALILGCSLAWFQHNHFWIQGYPEPMFVSFIFAGLLAWLRQKHLLAAVLLGLVACVRPQGIWLVAALSGLSLIGLGLPRKTIVPLLLPLAGSLYWQWDTTGNALYFMEQQKIWGRELGVMSAIEAHLPRYDDRRFFLWATLFLVAWTLVRWRRAAGPVAGVPADATAAVGAPAGWAPRFEFITKRPKIEIFILASALVFSEFPLFIGGLLSYSRFVGSNVFFFILLVGFLDQKRFWLGPWFVWNLSRLALFSTQFTFVRWTG
jgi:hypothetical protein